MPIFFQTFTATAPSAIVWSIHEIVFSTHAGSSQPSKQKVDA